MRQLFLRASASAADAAAVARRQLYSASVLDAVVEDINDLQAKLGSNDTQKVDEYLTGIRALERQIEEYNEPIAACSVPDAPSNDVQNDYNTHVSIMTDLMVLAFQCDLTRIQTFMLGNAGSGRNYDFIGVSGGHHQISHHQSLQENYDKLTQIDIWEVQQLVYLLTELDKIQEGTGTLLDNSCVFFSSEIEDGNSHAHTNLPVLLGGGVLPTGQHFQVPDKTPLANLFIALLNAMGVPTSTFGDDGTAALVL